MQLVQVVVLVELKDRQNILEACNQHWYVLPRCTRMLVPRESLTRSFNYINANVRHRQTQQTVVYAHVLRACDEVLEGDLAVLVIVHPLDHLMHGHAVDARLLVCGS